MNQTIKKVNQESILFIDIEDVRRTKELDVNSKEFELFQRKTRNVATDELLAEDEVIEQYNKRAALKMCYTKIVSIGVGFIKGDEVHIKSLEGTEEEIIKQFCNIAKSFDYLCGSNIIAFDLPMIVNNGYRYFDVCEVLPDRYITSGKKVWNLDRILDLQEIFKGTHYVPSSLDEMCYHFNIPSPKTDMDGSMVSEEYWNNGVEKINDYVKLDVFASINVFRKMRFQEHYTNFINKNKVSTATEKPRELTPMEKIVYTKDEATAEKVLAKAKNPKNKKFVEEIMK